MLKPIFFSSYLWFLIQTMMTLWRFRIRESIRFKSHAWLFMRTYKTSSCNKHVSLCHHLPFPVLWRSLSLFLFQDRVLAWIPADSSLLSFLPILSLGPRGVFQKGRRCASQNNGELGSREAPIKWETVMEGLGAIVTKPEVRRNRGNGKGLRT